MGRDGAEFALHAVAYVEAVNEVVDAFFGDGFVGACECLEGFVGMGIGLAAENGLYGFGHHCPAIVEVAADGLFVEEEFAETFECALERDEGMAHGYADVADYSGVGKVALQTADGEFAAEVFKDGIGKAEVSFGVFEVDGVDLVGHGA